MTRIGDEEREKTAKALGDHSAHGRLTHVGFEERLAADIRRPYGCGPARDRQRSPGAEVHSSRTDTRSAD